MKIALVFSGQARSFKESYKYYQENLLKAYEVDTFFHTWRHPRIIEQELTDLYQPKAFMFQDPEPDSSLKMPALLNGDQRLHKNVYMQSLSIYRSFLVLEKHVRRNNINYDFAIRTRFDFALNVQIRFDILDPSRIYLPNCRSNAEGTLMNDQFAVSSLTNMLDYSRTFLRLPFIVGTSINPNAGESLLEANLKFMGMVGDKIVYVNMNNPFPPGRYNSTWHSLIRDDYALWATN